MAGESKLQRKIILDLEKKGWETVKIIICTKPGWPDIQIYKKKRTVFLEVKDEGKEAKKLQEYRHEQLRKQGFEVYVIDTFQQYKDLKL